MTLSTSVHYAEKITTWLQLFVERQELAGSIRRERPECGDVDIVCIPTVTETCDLLGTVSDRRNHLFEFMREYVAQSGGKARFQSGGEKEGKSMVLQLPKCQLDLWFATAETFATRLLCRTGSMQHNIWLASRAKRQNKKWNPYEGVLTGGQWLPRLSLDDGDKYDGGTLKRFATEAEIYAEFGLPFIEPRNREHAWLVKEFGE